MRDAVQVATELGEKTVSHSSSTGIIESPTTQLMSIFLLEERSMTDSNPFVGTWKLVSWEATKPHDTIHYPYGKDTAWPMFSPKNPFPSPKMFWLPSPAGT